MIRMLLTTVAISAVVFANLSMSSADLVHDNGLLPFGNFSTGSDVALSESVAEDFRFSKRTYVNKVEFLGHYYNGAINDRFTVNFYKDAAGLPGDAFSMPTVLSILRTNGGFGPGVMPGFHYELQLSDSLFEAGQKYWVSITNDSSFTPAKNWWSWASTSAGPGDGSAVIDPSWRLREFDFAFRLHGLAVPEPAAGTLILLGAVFGLVIRR